MTNIIVVEGKRYIRCCQCVGSGTEVKADAIGNTNYPDTRSAGFSMVEVKCSNCSGTGLVEIPT